MNVFCPCRWVCFDNVWSIVYDFRILTRGPPNFRIFDKLIGYMGMHVRSMNLGNSFSAGLGWSPPLSNHGCKVMQRLETHVLKQQRPLLPLSGVSFRVPEQWDNQLNDEEDTVFATAAAHSGPLRNWQLRAAECILRYHSHLYP